MRSVTQCVLPGQEHSCAGRTPSKLKTQRKEREDEDRFKNTSRCFAVVNRSSTKHEPCNRIQDEVCFTIAEPDPFSGEFAELRKQTISFVMSVHKEQLGCNLTYLDKIRYLSSFLKSVEKTQVL